MANNWGSACLTLPHLGAWPTIGGGVGQCPGHTLRDLGDSALASRFVIWGHGQQLGAVP